ncbi:MAG TPA: hypothetical protein VFV30_02725 [Novosphingobium sp.]|nr:hypothetical protein [Novosphingobium sp.]
MGIDLHTFRFMQGLARSRPLGRVLTIGRQNVDFDPALAGAAPAEPDRARYCEWAFEALGAETVSSVDVSDYENATYVADLGQPTDLPQQFDTVIDAGSLEHVFDVVTAFRNVIGFTAIGGRIVHVLPVNNLSGHGFWQFSSDLLYALYAPNNGFGETRVYYASGLNPDAWHLVPEPHPGTRTELVSLEPVILLSVTTKLRAVDSLSVMQPFYAKAWEGTEAVQSKPASPSPVRQAAKRLRGTAAYRLARNAYTVAGLLFGTSRYALSGSRFARRSPSSGESGPP